jgi:Zn-finger protein
MNCKKCKVSILYKPLSRTNPKGQSDAGWMCQDCMKIHESELYKNLKDDNDFKISNAIFHILNDKSVS